MNKAVPSSAHSMILGVFYKSGMTSDMYPGDDELLAAIPNRDDMSPTKLIDGFLSNDNCATANKTGNNLIEKLL